MGNSCEGGGDDAGERWRFRRIRDKQGTDDARGLTKGRCRAGGFRVFRYPQWQYMGCRFSVVWVLMFAGVWLVLVREAGQVAWGPWGAFLIVLFLCAVIVEQIRRIRVEFREPFGLVVLDDELEVHWRKRVGRYKIREILLEEDEGVSGASFKGVSFSTPDGSFVVMQHLQGFEELMSILGRGGATASREFNDGRDHGP